MADVPEDVEALARHAWGAAQRIGMQIAELPLDRREAAFATAERAFQQAARELGHAGERVDEFIKIQMDAIREIVTNIDVGGSPQGGRAYDSVEPSGNQPFE